VSLRQNKGLEVVTSEIYYYETIKRELNRRLIYECRCDERLKVNVEGCTHIHWVVWGTVTDDRLFIIRGKTRVQENIYRWVQTEVICLDRRGRNQRN
jgi:hypothetical protein